MPTIKEPTITDPLLQETATSFEQLADAAFNEAQTASQKIEVLNSLFASLKTYTKDWKSHNPASLLLDNQGCPDGWDACPDGSCVPPGAGCGRELNFSQNELILLPNDTKAETLTIDQAKQLLSSYITHAASSYFANAQTEEMKQQTRLLLEVAMLDFKASVAPQAPELDLVGMDLEAGTPA